jgi:hypothetical protein
MLQKLHEGKLAPHKDRLEKKYYEIVQEESLEGKKY